MILKLKKILNDKCPQVNRLVGYNATSDIFPYLRWASRRARFLKKAPHAWGSVMSAVIIK